MTEPLTSPRSSRILRSAIWVAIGALIAAAIVCVIWVLLGDANGIVGKAFLTILLLAAFAGVAILEANLADRRPAWFSLASIVTWVLILLVGAVMIWMPAADTYFGHGVERFARFLLIVLILQGALLHIRLFSKAVDRHPTTFTSIVGYVTMGFVVILAVMLVLPLVLEEQVTFQNFYWRVVVALAILTAVGTTLVPLVNALFAPKKPRRVAPVPPAHAGLAPWPTYADGRTPLPVLPDGSPDVQAYYTGQPTYPQGYPAQAPLAQAAPQAPTPPAQPSPDATDAVPGYQGYPPPPPPPQ